MIANSFALYQKDISKQRVITKEEEDELFKKYLNGDRSAKDQIMLGHSKFVLSIAFCFFNKGLPDSDIISEGMIGLSRAIDRYEMDRGFKFISYAKLYVMGYILQAIHEKGNLIKIPLNKLKILNDFWKLQYHEQVELTDEISHLLNVKDYNRISLNDSQSDLTMEEIIKDPNGENPENVYSKGSNSNMIKEMLKELPDIERKILEKRFGFGGVEPYTYEQLSNSYGISIKQVKHFIEQSLDYIQTNPNISNYREMFEEYKESLDEQDHIQNKTQDYGTLQ